MSAKLLSIDKMANIVLAGLILVSVLVIVFWSIPSLAKNPESIPFHEYQEEMRQEGQVLSVHLSMGSPIRIFIVGREEAKIDLSKLELTVRRMNPYPGKVLKLDRYDNYFVVNDADPFTKNTTLELNAKVNNKVEKFKFKIKNKIP